MKKLLSLLLALTLALSLAACGSAPSASGSGSSSGGGDAEPITLVVFAAASLTETLTEIAGDYKAVAPNVTLSFNFDSSGKLLTLIEEGAECDLFLSAAPKQMNALDGTL